MSRFAFFFVLLATGCFHWAPITSLAEVEDARVQIATDDDMIELEHATAMRHLIVGQRASGEVAQVDVSEQGTRVRVRKLNPVGTGLIIGGAVATTAVGIIAVIIAVLSQPRDVPFAQR